MNIPPYPKLNSDLLLGFDLVDEMIKWVNSSFGNEFESRYYPKFNWFKSETPRNETILNIGCDKGKETFALMWSFKANEAIGIGKDQDGQQNDIFVANGIANTIRDFSQKFIQQVIPDISKHTTPEYVKSLLSWHQELPTEINGGIVPTFQIQDVSKEKLHPHNYFDLIYSRYVLDKILLKDGEGGLIFALQGMMDVVVPITGRIVFVVPTKNADGKAIQYNFDKIIPKALTLVKTERDEQRLGGSEWPYTEPVGYIYTKQS